MIGKVAYLKDGRIGVHTKDFNYLVGDLVVREDGTLAVDDQLRELLLDPPPRPSIEVRPSRHSPSDTLRQVEP